MNYGQELYELECRSDEAHRRRYCNGFCRNCYMRLWRREKKLRIERRESKLDETKTSLQNYKQRNLPIIRRGAVQRLADTGKREEEIIVAFGERDELLELLAGLQDPVKALKRDLAELTAGNRNKTASQIMVARQIRQLQDQIDDEELSARDRSRLYERLHGLEREKAESLSHTMLTFLWSEGSEGFTVSPGLGSTFMSWPCVALPLCACGSAAF